MEEAPVVDCPPTPEILPLSVTPPRPEVVYSSSSEEVDETVDGRRSPPPKCAICLGKCRQPAFANTCNHQFCFRCLLEWSKVKPECPLCKQRFLSIIYYKSVDCFEQHTIPVPTVVNPPARIRNRETYHELNLFLSNAQRFPTYSIPPDLTLRWESNIDRLQEALLHTSSEVERFAREYGNRPVPSRSDQIRWRQFIYANRLYACPMMDLNRRFRDTSAAFYRENPAQMHRILTWMHRDLLALGVNINVHAPNMNVLEDLLQTHDLDSREFLLRMMRFMPVETGEHFQHECTNFARSPYDIIGYDLCVQYNPRYLQPRMRGGEVIISSSEEDNDDIVYLPEASASTSNSQGGTGGEGASTNSGGTTSTTGTNTTTGSGSSSSGTTSTSVHIEFRSVVDSAGNEELQPVVVSATSQSQQGVNVLPRVPLTSTASTSTVPTENILLSSSDSDDCQFVLAQKPPHLRTPDHVVDLESASDSDVVFVAEEQMKGAPTPRVARDQHQQGNLMKKETAVNRDYNNGASTSSGYCGGGNGGGSSGSVASFSALRTKHYARPRLTRYSGGIGVKSIYEASDSDDSDTHYNTRQKSGEADSKGRSKKKRSRMSIEKQSKRSKEKSTATVTATTTTSPAKSKPSRSKAKQKVSKGASTKAKSKSKSGARRASKSRNNRNKKRSKPAADNETTRSTPLLEENASTETHYVIASRPSVSPTIDVTTVDGAECRERKLKSVIIKRCHYNKPVPATCSDNALMDDAQPGPAASVNTAGPSGSEYQATTSTLAQERVDSNIKQEALLKCEPAENDLQLSSSYGSSTESEPQSPGSPAGWDGTGVPSVILNVVEQTCSSVSYNLTPSEQQHWPQQPEHYLQAQTQLPIANNDQHPQPLASSLLEADESNTVASESIFEPTLSWAGSETTRSHLPDDRGLSSAATSPFSSISYPPSATSISPSPSLSSQSLALPTVASPLQLIESMGTMDSESPLPSSVLHSDAIRSFLTDEVDGTIGEMMTTEEVVTATSSITEPAPIATNGPEVEGGPNPSDNAEAAMEPVSTVSTSAGSTGVQLQL
uniref:RING-type E3 ubiquitin transferase n=1 Tax=Anopheles epiroticus TaxID=199890 RepID=A0A182PNF2_9DIPT